MSKIKITVTVSFVVLAMCAIASASASADWLVGGTEFSETSSTELSTTAKVSSALLLTVPEAKIKISCKGTTLKMETPKLSGTYRLEAKSLTYEGCETTEPATNCALSLTLIKTNPVLATTGTGEGVNFPEGRLTFKPKEGTTLAKVAFNETDTCAFHESESLKGNVTMDMPTAFQETKLQAIEGLGTTENNSLEIGTDKAYLSGGKAELKQASEQAFYLRLNVTIEKSGGVGIAGTTLCPFTLMNQKCQITLTNNEGFQITISAKLLQGTNGTSRYNVENGNCTQNATVNASAFCQEEVKLKQERNEATEPAAWNNTYYLALFQTNVPNNVGVATISLSR